MERKIIGIEDKVPFNLLLPLSLQHTFAMFGASVLVPILFGINPSIVLFMNGIGTLLFIAITKGKSPAYLGSSFAFIAPTLLIMKNPNYGFKYALGAFVIVGIIGMILSFVIHKYGVGFIDIILPPAAMGPVVALIGLQLTGFTIKGGRIGANLTTFEGRVVFGVTLLTAIIGSLLFRKFFATIPILIAMIVGYLVALYFGTINVSSISSSTIFTIPNFQLPKFAIAPILIMLPAIFVILSEHISHQVVTSNIVGKDLLKDPGLDKTLFADNFSSALSGLIGGVPTTTYGENIGVMAITRVYSVRVIAGAAIFSIIMSFFGPFTRLIDTIPGDVIGGVTFLLYGMIGTSGIRLIVDKKVDYSKTSNLILTSVVFVAGLSGLTINFFGIELAGMTLAAVVGIILSLMLHIFNKFNLIV